MLFVAVLFAAACLVTGLAIWMFSPDAASGALPLTMGLFTLMATPVLRIVFSLAYYLSIRDLPFAATAAVVLIILGASLLYAWRI